MTEFRKKRLLEQSADLREKIDDCLAALRYAESPGEMVSVVKARLDHIRSSVLGLQMQLEQAANDEV